MKRASEREYLAKLRQTLDRRFDEGELRTLCFDLEVDYDNLPGEGKANKARELVAYLDRRLRIPELVRLGKQLRPDISWEDIPRMTREAPQSAPLERLPARVFISYNHRDKDFVRRLAGDLRSRGVEVWWDEWEIGVGDSIIQRVSEGIDTSSYLIVVLSPNSIGSEWVRRELDSALMQQLSAERNITVLPVIITSCKIPALLRPIKWADFRESYEYGLHQLLRAIGVMGFGWMNTDAERFVQAGRDAARAGRYPKAEKLFREVLKRFPDYPPALSGLANVRYHQGRYQEGITCATKTINVDPQFPYAYYQRGLCLWAAGNPRGAVKDFERALELKPDFEYARNKLNELRQQGYL